MTDAKMFSDRVLPWMKLGTRIDGPVSPTEAIEMADLDWEVNKHPLYTELGGTMTEVNDRFAIVRDSDNAVLGTVGSSYETYQNREAFTFLEPLTDDGQVKIYAAGQVRGGKQVFMVAEIPGLLQDVMDDPHEMHAVIRTGHDGTKAVQILLMGLRGLCMNALALPSFSSTATQRWSVPHTSNMQERLEVARGSMVSIERYDREFTELAERLAAIDIERDEFEKLLHNALPPMSEKTRDQIVLSSGAGFELSPTIQDQFRGTGWGALNAVTEHMAWGRTRGTDEGRYHSTIDGAGIRIQRQVVGHLLARA